MRRNKKSSGRVILPTRWIAEHFYELDSAAAVAVGTAKSRQVSPLRAVVYRGVSSDTASPLGRIL